MKIYNIIYVLMALLVIGCSKSDEGTGGEKEQKSVDADYVVLVANGGTIKTGLLNATAEVMTLNPAESALSENPIPLLTSIDGTIFYQYHKETDCSGKIIKHDFATNITEEFILFDDMNDCMLTATAIIFSETYVYVAYELEIDSKNHEYMVRIIDLGSTGFDFEDVSLSKKPVDLALAKNQLFILTHDTEVSDENFLSVMDLNTNSLIHEMNLGFRARRIFRNMADDIIISYDELHTTLNSSTMSAVYTNYEEGTEPKFTLNKVDNFDLTGRLYYPIVSESVSSYPEIPAVYDFTQNLTVLYAFENFLTEEKRNFEFEIETATAINYDTDNDIILIGYKKINKQKGGIMRIKPAPEPEFIDNIDLDGVPYEIILN